jgi:hypothetical protein
MSIDARLDRAASAAEGAAAALTRIANAADNLGRVADALETLTALFASVVGVGKTTCYGSGNGAEYGPPVNFIRSGQGKDVFACDADNSEIEE